MSQRAKYTLVRLPLPLLASFYTGSYSPDPPALRGVVGEVRKRENEELSMDMAEPGSPPPFPFPSQVSWTKDGEEVESQLSTRVFNYSSIFIGSVQPSDSGLYRLSATNFLLDSDTILGSDTANFTLNVLCEWLHCALCSVSVHSVYVVRCEWLYFLTLQ